ncbi:hypothetical protein EJ110_NYTH36586 [Nymphaea thermarum]|nr:hypothetical protein EJ110_NYTH36586 [Nymphaea thermarum]
MSFIQDFRDIPGKALVNAITPASSIATNLTVPTLGILSVDATYYYIFYFSEVSQATYRNKSRSFDFLVDGIKRNGGPIIPPYQSYKTDQDRIRYLTTGSVISLVNIADASLLPILNAMEVFRVQRGLAAGTNTYDGGLGLSGTLPDFSGLTALEIMYIMFLNAKAVVKYNLAGLRDLHQPQGSDKVRIIEIILI